MSETAGFYALPESSVRDWLYRLLPRPAVAGPRDAAARPKRVLVLHKGPNASLDYYLKARLEALRIPYELRCIDRDRLHDIDPDGLFIILCRYVRPSQAYWIARRRGRLAGVAYFVDDDIPALVADRQTDLGYRFYLAYFACLPMLGLKGSLTHLWASTPALARALGGGGRDAAVLGPAPVVADHVPPEEACRSEGVRIVYHATDVHSREHRFLVPVMEEVLRRRPGASFEVLARGRNLRFWQEAAIAPDRLAILSPMGWEDYCRHSRANGADIALMPLMEGLANDSRADTKLIDCARLGSAALMSDVGPYRRESSKGVLRAENAAGAWIEALVELIDRAELRAAAKLATRESVLAMTPDAHEPFPGLPAGDDDGDRP